MLWSSRLRRARGALRPGAALLAAAAAGAGLVAVPVRPTPTAGAAGPSSTFALVVTPQTSGTAPFDSAAGPGLDQSGDPAVDRVVRTLDTVDVKIDWSLTAVAGTNFKIAGVDADSNLTVTATLPLGAAGQPAAVWTSIPTACYLTSSGVTPTIAPLSSLTSASRTLTCNLGHKQEGSTGNFNATFRMTGYATDGTRVDVQAAILADSTRSGGNAATQSAAETFWSSGGARYNLRLDQRAFAVSGVRSGPANEPGRVVTVYAQILQPKGTEAIGVSSVGPPSSGTPFSFEIDLSAFGAVPATDGSPGNVADRARLYTWNGQPCGSASFRCTQPGGAGTPVRVEAFGVNTGNVPPNNTTSVAVQIWLPNAALPTTSTELMARASGFDPRTVGGPTFAGGQSNYGGSGEACPMVATGTPNPASCEPGLVRAASAAAHTSANDNEYSVNTTRLQASSALTAGYHVDGDIRNSSSNNQFASDANYATQPFRAPSGSLSDANAQVLANVPVLASSGIQNNGGLVNSGAVVCQKWDNRTQVLTDFGDPARPITPQRGNAAFVPGTWSVVLTGGTPPNPPAVWNPSPKWNKTPPFNSTTPHNLEADPAAYVVQFGVGEYNPYSPPPTAPAFEAMRTALCRDADSPAGWFTDPNDPAIQTWIDSIYGAGSGITPLDVVNKVRVRLLDDLQPNQSVDLTVRLTVRSAYGATTTGGLAGTPIPVGTKIVQMGAFTDSVWAAQPNSATRLNGWYIGNYNANNDGGTYGDRLTLARVDVRGATASLWPSPTGANGVASVIAGQDVWIRAEPYVYADGGVPPGAPAYPARFVTLIPDSLTYVPGSGCRATTTYQPTNACANPIEPVIVPNADGTTTLVWDLGTYAPNTGTARTAVQFKTTTDVLTANGTVARVQNVIESRNPDGTANSLLPVCTSNGSIVNLAVPATSNGPAETLALPDGCTGYRESAVTIRIYNPNGLVFSGRAPSQQIEVNEKDDGSGTKFAYKLTIKNFSTVAIPWTDTIMVLPYNRDGRDPATSYTGTFALQGASASEAAPAVPNALPPSSGPMPPRSGTTIYYSKHPPQSIDEDPLAPPNAEGSTTRWCLASELGVVAACPSSMAEVTAVRVISGSLAANGAQRTVTLRFESDGNRRGDVYVFHARSRGSGYALLLRSVDTSISVVDSSLGGTLWRDDDGNGLIDSTESGRVVGVRVQLLDANGVVVGTTITNTSGAYSFGGLHSGTYTARVVTANGVDGVADRYATLGNDYDLDNGTIGGPDGDPDMQATVDLGRNVYRSDVAFGFAPTSLSGRAWRDDSRDGLVDPGELPMSNQEITLTGVDDVGATVNRTTRTGVDGRYTFSDLRPGTYSVAITATPGSVVAYAGSAGGTVSGAQVDTIVLVGGMTATGYRFGMIAPSVTITVYVDADNNRRKGALERGLANIRGRISSRDQLGRITSDLTYTDLAGLLSLYS